MSNKINENFTLFNSNYVHIKMGFLKKSNSVLLIVCIFKYVLIE